MTQPRSIIVAGGTGLVGRKVLHQLANHPGIQVTALVRRTGTTLPAGIQEHLFNYEDPASYKALGTEIPCDILLCCLGTTRKKAGSDKAFRRVDRDYPRMLLEQLTKLDTRPVFGLVSSVGADQAVGLYLKTKAEIEAAILASGLPYVIVRPSLLLGEREEHRFGEHVSSLFTVPLFKVLQRVTSSTIVNKYAPVEGTQVAAALIHGALDQPEPHLILEGNQLQT